MFPLWPNKQATENIPNPADIFFHQFGSCVKDIKKMFCSAEESLSEERDDDESC